MLSENKTNKSQCAVILQDDFEKKTLKVHTWVSQRISSFHPDTNQKQNLYMPK